MSKQLSQEDRDMVRLHLTLIQQLTLLVTLGHRITEVSKACGLENIGYTTDRLFTSLYHSAPHWIQTLNNRIDTIEGKK